jgi:hypothetical protein
MANTLVNYKGLEVPASTPGEGGRAIKENFMKLADRTDGSLGITIDGGGSAIQTGQKGSITVPFACTISSWWLTADASGSIAIDVWKASWDDFPPTSGDSVCGGAKPSLSSQQKNKNESLTAWTTAIAAGDVLAFNVDSASTVTKVTLVLKVVKN